ncbi:tetratricopeptide repeat protein, partial [Micromonospora sp. NPDC048894]|uniref:tetratricopeptide repeat protein n=1 Tax=Micromonospora sp. NPDC048894 TaxID=3155493 RepID=UPI003411EA38
SDAMNNLGILLKQRGDSQEEAEQWYRRAADTGHTDAMYNLGILLEQRGSQDEAEQWYRRAAGTGHRPAMSNLRALLEQRGDGEQPEGYTGMASRRACTGLGTLRPRHPRCPSVPRPWQVSGG